MEFKVGCSQPRWAILNLPLQILGGHPADLTRLGPGKRQQVGLKSRVSDLCHELLRAGFHLCGFLELQHHQWHCKKGATVATVSDRG